MNFVLTLGFLNQIGMPELIFIGLIVLIIFGPKSLPALGRALGQGIREFKGASAKMTEALDEAVREEDRKASQQARPAEPKQIAPDNVYTAPPKTVATTPNGVPEEKHS